MQMQPLTLMTALKLYSGDPERLRQEHEMWTSHLLRLQQELVSDPPPLEPGFGLDPDALNKGRITNLNRLIAEAEHQANEFSNLLKVQG